MEGYLARRLSDPRFASLDARVEFEQPRSLEHQWYEAPRTASEPPLSAALTEAPLVAPAGGQVVRANASKKGPCWTGYHKVEGKADYADGSCAKNGSSGKDKKKKKDKKKTKREKKDGGSSSSSSSDDDGGKRKKRKAAKTGES
jgi:hypothetical protein